MDLTGWEEKYKTGERGKEDRPTALVQEAARMMAPGRAIDLACGTGRNSIWLAEQGWDVTAIDGSETAIQLLQARAAGRGVAIRSEVCDLTRPDFTLSDASYELGIIAFYWQRDLLPKIQQAVCAGGMVAAIAHVTETGEEMNPKWAAKGEMREFFSGWEILWEYEGESRDPVHKRPVAEILARKPVRVDCSR
jgi:SAM-dependent methyltransferase